MKRARFFWKSTCSTCRDARAFLRDELRVELDERDYAREPLRLSELQELFAGNEPAQFINPRSPAFKARGLAGIRLDSKRALQLMAEEQNLVKRPLTLVSGEIVAGFDRERLRKLFI